MAQLNYTDKSLKRIIELIPKFQNALGEEEVVEHFRSIVSKVLYFSVALLVLFYILIKYSFAAYCSTSV